MSEALGITFEEIDRAGVVTLDRPDRLNALNREMFEGLSAHYRRWAPAPHIYGVVMQSSHPKVFSSGGARDKARTKIVEGAVGMVEMALAELARTQVVTLDEERKAAMVSNLLVVLCSEHAASPVLNAGTLYP